MQQIFGVLSLILIAMAAGCRHTPPAPAKPSPLGHRLSNLPTAEPAPTFEPPGDCYAEALLDENDWWIRQPVSQHLPTMANSKLSELPTEAKQTSSIQGFQPILLLSADADTPFSRIAALGRAAANEGFPTIHFLVRPRQPETGASAPRSFALNLSYEGIQADPSPFLSPTD